MVFNYFKKMIDIAQYRCRIGRFCQKPFNKKFLYRNYESEKEKNDVKLGRNVMSCLHVLLKITLILVLTKHARVTAPDSIYDSSGLQCGYLPLARDSGT